MLDECSYDSVLKQFLPVLAPILRWACDSGFLAAVSLDQIMEETSTLYHVMMCIFQCETIQMNKSFYVGNVNISVCAVNVCECDCVCVCMLNVS